MGESGMIRGRCRTNPDDYKREEWPTFLLRRPTRIDRAATCEHVGWLSGRCTRRWRVVVRRGPKRRCVCRWHARHLMGVGWERDIPRRRAPERERPIWARHLERRS